MGFFVYKNKKQIFCMGREKMRIIKKLLFIICVCFTYGAMAAPIGWNVKNNGSEIIEKFAISQDIETYTGDVMQFNLSQAPSDGHVFVLYKLKIEKESADAPDFVADEFVLHVGDKTYNRLTDDAFLIDYSYTVLPHLPLKVGQYSGAILFEIPIEHKDITRTLIYKNNKME